MTRVWPLVALFALAATRVVAQDRPRDTGAIVLELPTSPRALSLGGTAASLSGDDAAIFGNPALLALAPARSAGFSMQRYVASSTLAAVSASMRLGSGSIGLGVQALDYGSADEIVVDPADPLGGSGGVSTGGRASAADLAAAIGYGWGMGRLRLGATARVVRQRIVEASGTAPALDVGVALDAGARTTIAASLQHLGGTIALAGSRAALPRTVRVGLSSTLLRRATVDATGVAELSQVRGAGPAAAGGIELGWRPTASLRLAGRIGRQARPSGSDARATTVGGGLTRGRIGLDYAYQAFRSIGGTHRLGVRWWR